MKRNFIFKAIVLVMMVVTILTIAGGLFESNAAGETVTPPGDISGTYTNVSGITNLGGSIIGIVTTIGSVVSVIVLVVLGLKYMMGSAEEKAEYKKTLMPYVIGAVLVFAASTVANVVFNFASGISA